MFIPKLTNNMHLRDYDIDEDEYVPRGTLNRQYPKGKFNSWVELDRGYQVPSHNTREQLEPGVFCFRIHREQICLKKENLFTDELYEFKDSIAELICNEYKKFAASRDQYLALKLSHRRGIFMYGAQGCGKTSVVHRIIHHAVDSGAIALQMDVNPELFTAGLRMIRGVEPERPIVCFMEDIDALIEKFGEASLLSLLDGESQVNGVFNIATSNYPEKLDRRLVNRPRRFDRVIRVEKPSQDLRRQYLQKKLELLGQVDEAKIEALLEASDGLSFSALTELVISTEIMDIPLEEAKVIVRKVEKNKHSSTDEKGKMGFNDG